MYIESLELFADRIDSLTNGVLVWHSRCTSTSIKFDNQDRENF